MARKVSIEAHIAEAKAEEIKAQGAFVAPRTYDSYQNFAAKMGVGADNLISYSTYGFNPITRNRILLEWVHRGSWIGGVAVDVVGDDMTRMGVRIKGSMDPDDISHVDEIATQMRIWPEINDTVRWSRLYGGAICVLLIDGQRMDTPLRVDTVGKSQFKGLLTLDRWQVDPSMSDLVTEFGPDLGMPKFYRVTSNAPALQGQKVHYTRVLRMDGIRLPYNQRLTEQLWGISVLERLYDRMIAFDSATQGAAQLVYRSYLRTVSMKDLRENIAAGGTQMDGVIQYINMMGKFQSIEGVTLLDAEDIFAEAGNVNFGGLSEALTQFCQQLAGALQIPLVRLFGQSPSGFSTGEADLRMYYDSIRQQQHVKLKVPITNIYRCIAQSEGIEVEDGFSIDFVPLWQLTDAEKAGIASQVTSFVSTAREGGVVKPEVALQELKQSSEITGYWSNITDDDIKEAEEAGPPQPENVEAQEAKQGVAPGQEPPPAGGEKAPGASKDSASTVALLHQRHNIQVVIENPAGSIRRGIGWEVLMPDDYGYIRRHEGADGDAIDCYVGKDTKALNAYVIDQRDLRTGLFDEHKIMFGYTTAGAAIETYNLGFDDGRGPDRLMGCTAFSLDGEFQEWLHTSDLNQPCKTHDAAKFKEDEHPRVKSGAHAGEFSKGGRSGKATVKYENPTRTKGLTTKVTYTAKEADAVYSYVGTLDEGTSKTGEIQKALRTGKGSSDIVKLAKLVNDTIKKTRLTKAILVYRGVSGAFAESLLNLKVGTKSKAAGILSTSAHEDYAESFSVNYSSRGKKSAGVMLRVLADKGTPALGMAALEGGDTYGRDAEGEIMFAHGTVFEITNVDKKARTVTVNIVGVPK